MRKIKDKQSKRLFLTALCIILSLFGLFYTFGAVSSEDEQKKESNEKEIKNAYEYEQKQLPNDENESEDEAYTDGKKIKVYFTNTEKIDSSSLPLAAHAILCQEAQKYLDAGGFGKAAELKIMDKGFSDNEDAVTFQCMIAGYEETLAVTYKKEERTLKFDTVEMERIEK